MLLITEDMSAAKRIGETILNAFPQHEFEFHTVDDAAQAAVLLEKGVHELVVVDIDLPDAISAMEELRPLARGSLMYALLDGFGSLKRMQSVLRASLDGYFLKQADASFLRSTLRQLYARHQQAMERQREEDGLRLQVEREKPYLFENFIRDLFSGTTEDPQLLENTGAYLQEFIDAQDRFCVVAVRPVDAFAQAERHFADMIRLRDDVKRWMPSVNKLCLMYHKYIVLLLSMSAWENIPNAQLLLEYGLRSHIADYERRTRLRISVGTSMECTGLASLHTAFLQAKAAAKWGIRHEEMLPLVLFNDYVNNSGVSFLIDHRMIEELLDAQTGSESRSVRAIMQRHLAHISLTGARDQESMRRLRMDATAMLMLAASSLSVPLDIQHINTLLNHTDFATTTELVDWFVERMETLAEYRKHTTVRKEQMLVEHAKALVAAEPGRHFTTQEMAARLGIGVSYFGTIFKRCEGITFLDYMTNQTLLRAVTLLSDPQLRLNEVCLKVGFKDANYFARVFKKHYGCTPSQFRNKMK